MIYGVHSKRLSAIPIGITYDYRVLGNEPADPDQERIPFDDPTIGFDWTTRPR